VAKRIVRIENRLGLVESVVWEQVQEQVNALPSANEVQSFQNRSAPGLAGAGCHRSEYGGLKRQPMSFASTSYQPKGFCIDYTTVSGSGVTTLEQTRHTTSAAR
jgi:hypothetical protein